MVDVPISFTADERTYGGLPSQLLKNRFFEANPTQLKGAAMLARPGTEIIANYGDGPIRANYSQQGLFNGALFTVSGDTMFRRDPDGTTFTIAGEVRGDGEVSMTGVAGAGFERLFVADGTLLQYYEGPSFAYGLLTVAVGAPATFQSTLKVHFSALKSTLKLTDPENGRFAKIKIGSLWYQWALDGTVDNASGTDTDPYQVKFSGYDAPSKVRASLESLVAAINASGQSGVDYSAGIISSHPDVIAELRDDLSIVVTARSSAAFIIPVGVFSDNEHFVWSNAFLVGVPPKNGDVVRVGDMFYQWVDTVTGGAGTESDPWQVLIGSNMASALSNLDKAINATGTYGYEHTVGITPNPAGSSTLTPGQKIVISVTNTLEINDEPIPTAFIPVGNELFLSWTSSRMEADPLDGDKIQIGDTWYQWAANVTAPGADGTQSNPFLVSGGESLSQSLENMVAAINFTGEPGDTYSSSLGGPNTQVRAEMESFNTLRVTAISNTSEANSIVTSAEPVVTDFIQWESATLVNGGVHALIGIEMPDDLPPIQVATLKAHVIVGIGNSDRFYWIRPGETEIDPLDFATAESQPDDVVAVRTVGDTVWFIGQQSTEVWFATGNLDAPFSPVNGRVFDQGAVEGTVVNIKGSIFLVGSDFTVYGISGGVRRVSNHGVEQTIRAAFGG